MVRRGNGWLRLLLCVPLGLGDSEGSSPLSIRLRLGAARHPRAPGSQASAATVTGAATGLLSGLGAAFGIASRMARSSGIAFTFQRIKGIPAAGVALSFF